MYANTGIKKRMCGKTQNLEKIIIIKWVHKFDTEMTTVDFKCLLISSNKKHHLQILLIQRSKNYLLTRKDTFII